MNTLNLKKVFKIGCTLVLSANLLTSSILAMEKKCEDSMLNVVSTAADEAFPKHIDGLDDRPTVLPTPGKHTLFSFLSIAVYPVGAVLYTWGGGWNPLDARASKTAKTIGLDQTILYFTCSHYSENRPNTEAEEEETEDVTYKTSEGKIIGVSKKGENVAIPAIDPAGNPLTRNGEQFLMFKYIYFGMDCSGFVGWVVYNLVNDKSGNEGYVGKSTTRAEFFNSKGWGKLKEITKKQIDENTYEMHPGDIVSIRGHVYISLGKCADGSILLIHSSPPGVSIMGTTDKEGNTASDAISLAQKYNAKYPKWFEWYNKHDDRNFSRPFDRYLTNAKCFTWNVDGNILTDPEGVQKMTPEQIIDLLFGNIELAKDK